MKKLKNTEGNLLKRLYYNNKDSSPQKNSIYKSSKLLSTIKNNLNSRINELDKSLDVVNVLNQINKTSAEKDRKMMLKSIIRKHYLSLEK